MTDFGSTQPPSYTPPPMPEQEGFPQRREVSGKAVASLVFGCFGIFMWIFAAVPALILALLAFSDIRSRPDKYSGRGVAVVGMLLGFAGLFIAPIMFFGMIGSMMSATPQVAMADGDRLVHLRLEGGMAENPRDAFSPFFGLQQRTLRDYIATVDAATEDEEIQGLILTSAGLSLGLAQVEELHGALMRFRASGKPIYVHGTDLSTGSYALMSAADRINMVPTDTLMLTGLFSESMYLGDVLEKIGVSADMMQMGDFKAANETLTRNAPTEAAIANQEWMLDGFYDAIVSWIAEGRGVSADTVKEWIDGGPYLANHAMDAGVIDSVSFLDEFLASVQAEHDDVFIDNDYWPDGMLPGGFGTAPPPFEIRDDSIALIYATGMIMRGFGEGSPFEDTTIMSGDMVRLLDGIVENDNISALVIRIDSPGGSAVASEEILRGVERVRERIPVVISMGNTAASGGYYIACTSDAIYADAGTLTASIGVVGGKLNMGGMWDEIGVGFHSTQRGKNADIFNMNQPFTDEQRAWWLAMMQDTYDVFREHVVEGRGDKLTQSIDEMAGGRVFTGVQALDLGLIDTIGTLEDAIAHAAELALLDDYDVQVLPRSVTFWEAFFAGLSGEGGRWSDLSFPDEASTDVPTVSAQFEIPRGDASATLQLLEEFDPEHASMILEAIRAGQLLQDESVLALMPSQYLVR